MAMRGEGNVCETPELRTIGWDYSVPQGAAGYKKAPGRSFGPHFVASGSEAVNRAIQVYQSA
jgi:hypothetical protein